MKVQFMNENAKVKMVNKDQKCSRDSYKTNILREKSWIKLFQISQGMLNFFFLVELLYSDGIDYILQANC